MDLSAVLKACLRRWWLTLPLLLGVAMMAWLAYDGAGKTYTTSVDYVLLQSPVEVLVPEDAETRERNPVEAAGGSRQIADIAASRLMSKDGLDELEDAGFSSTFTVSVDRDSALMTVALEGVDPRSVVSDLKALDARLRQQVADFQTQIQSPLGDFYNPVLVAEDASPAVQRGDATRAAGAVALLGVAISLFLVAIVDGVIKGRSSGARGRRARSPNARNAASRGTGKPASSEAPEESA